MSWTFCAIAYAPAFGPVVSGLATAEQSLAQRHRADQAQCQ